MRAINCNWSLSKVYYQELHCQLGYSYLKNVVYLITMTRESDLNHYLSCFTFFWADKIFFYLLVTKWTFTFRDMEIRKSCGGNLSWGTCNIFQLKVCYKFYRCCTLPGLPSQVSIIWKHSVETKNAEICLRNGCPLILEQLLLRHYNFSMRH